MEFTGIRLKIYSLAAVTLPYRNGNKDSTINNNLCNEVQQLLPFDRVTQANLLKLKAMFKIDESKVKFNSHKELTFHQVEAWADLHSLPINTQEEYNSAAQSLFLMHQHTKRIAAGRSQRVRTYFNTAQI